MVSTFSFLWQSLSSLLRSLLQSLGLAGKEGSLLLLGLDNAGKTTLLHRLKTGGDIRPFPPTDRPSTQEEFTLEGIQFSAWDLGGHEAVRHLWEDYVSTQVSAVLFVLDAADSERLEEAAYELDALVGLLQGIPVALLLNKCDLPAAMGTAEICERLEFARLQQEHGNEQPQKEQMAVFRISVLKGEGYQDAFRWIGGFL
jgi:GTP-binding protein SAR1